MAKRDTLLASAAAIQQYLQDQSDIKNLTTFGFSSQDLSDYFGGYVTPQQALSLHRAVDGNPTANDAALFRTWQGQTFNTPGVLGGMNLLDEIERGLNYLSQHPKGSKYHGDFNFSFKNPIIRGLAAFASGGLSEYGLAASSAIEHGKQGKGGAIVGDIVGAGVQSGGAGGASLSNVGAGLQAAQPQPPKPPSSPAVQPLSSPDSSLAVSPRGNSRKRTQTLLTGSNGLNDDPYTSRPNLLGGNSKTLGR